MKTNLHCHNCGGYFDAEFDESINGDHVVYCPNCGHDHYRTIKDGIVTAERWGQSPNQPSSQGSQGTYYIQGTVSNFTVTSGTNSVSWGTTGSISSYVTDAWYNTTASSTS